MNHLALDTIGKCAFGFDFDTVLSGESNVSKTFSELLQGADFRHLIRKALIRSMATCHLQPTKNQQSCGTDKQDSPEGIIVP